MLGLKAPVPLKPYSYPPKPLKPLNPYTSLKKKPLDPVDIWNFSTRSLLSGAWSFTRIIMMMQVIHRLPVPIGGLTAEVDATCQYPIIHPHRLKYNFLNDIMNSRDPFFHT